MYMISVNRTHKGSKLAPASNAAVGGVLHRARPQQQLSYVYREEEPGRQSAAKLLSKDEAR
jgi:hypothetical protein